MRPIVALGLAALLQAGEACATSPEETQEVSKAGSLLQIGIPVLGFGLTFLLDATGTAAPGSRWQAEDALDPLRLTGRPRHDFLAASLRTELMTYSLKASVDERRPNGGPHSFPSGHTSMAFMGAEFMRKEYGWFWGVPAYAAASFVGWTRVASHNHHPGDVYAGAAIGVFGNHDVAEFPLASGTLSVRPALLFANPAPDAIPAADAAVAGGLGLLLRFDFASR